MNQKELVISYQLLERQVALKPSDFRLWLKKAELSQKLGAVEVAIESLLKASELIGEPQLRSQVLESAVDVCARHAQFKYGAVCSERFLELNPNSAKALFFSGFFLFRCKFLIESIEFLLRAAELAPDNPACQLYIGQIYNARGQGELALPFFESCLALDEKNIQAKIGKSYALLCMHGVEEAKVYKAHLALAPAFSRSPKKLRAGMPEGNKKPRIGFVSGDFYWHSVSYFFLSLLKGEFSERFDVYCYSDTDTEDDMSEAIKARVANWSDTKLVDDQRLSEQISNDGIDVLVDLAGYVGKLRMGVFARKPAPKQVTFIGYPHTTGLPEMDYRVVDQYTDPEGLTEETTVEQLLHAPMSFLCFTPDPTASEVTELPACERGSVCFGSFNNFTKINEKTIEVWSQILLRVKDSTLFIKAGPLHDARFCEFVLERFECFGVGRERIELLGWTATRRAHLELYGKVDLHLDTFPYNGTTTTCEAAWQGVPTLTFKGDTHRSRVGYSLMSHIGLEDFVAESLDDYIELSVAKASDLKALSALRGTMREKMKDSYLLDQHSYSADMVELFQNILN